MKKVKKRLTKELDKLWRTGKYWEWVDQVRDGGLIADNTAQWEEAWRTLSRLALRLPAYLEDFSRRLTEHPQAPNLPDIVFIRTLAATLADHAIPGDLATLAGLSPAAQMLRTRLLEWQPDAKKERQVVRFAHLSVQKPEQITGRYYKELGAAIHPNPLAATLALLATAINRIRRLTSKQSEHGWRLYCGENSWPDLDNDLQHQCHTLEPTVRAVLLYPLCFQVWQCARQSWEKADFGKIVWLTAALPYLCSQTFGAFFSELQQYAQQHTAETLADNALLHILAASRNQDLESQAVALGKVSKALQDRGGFPDERLVDSFWRAYRVFLTKLQNLQASLSPREKIELQHVMDPILFAAWHIFEEERDEDEFLDLAILSGAGGARISMLVLLLDDLDLNPATYKQAQHNLQKLPYPGNQAILEILGNPKAIPFPEVHLFKPVLAAYPQEKQLRQMVAGEILNILNRLLWVNGTQYKAATNPRSRKDIEADCRRTMSEFSYHLQALSGFPEMAPLRALAQCFPEGYFTSAGYQRLLAQVWQSSTDLSAFLENVGQFFQSPAFSDHPIDLMFSALYQPFQDHLNSLLSGFLAEHSALLDEAPLPTLAKVVQRCSHPDRRLDNQQINFLLHLSDVLNQRLQGGDPEAERLYNCVLNIVLENRTVGHRPSSRQRKRRR